MANRQTKKDLKFKKYLVVFMKMQEQAIKNNLTLQIANMIIGIMLFILILVGIILK